jgi:dihydroorotase-like cyclic amidohydrolase
MMQSGGARGHPPILIRQAEIVNEDGILVGDVLIEDGVIK